MELSKLQDLANKSAVQLIERIPIRITFIQPVLGTLPGDPELAKKYVLDKHPKGAQSDEEKSLPDVDEDLREASTFFARNEKKEPVIYDYHVRGFLKAACGALRKVTTTRSSKLKSYKKVIDTLIFVFPRVLVLEGTILPKMLERPLRAETAKGPRVCLARSEQMAVGTYFDCELGCFDDKYLNEIFEWLSYGQYSGISQWRNGSFGRFTWALRES